MRRLSEPFAAAIVLLICCMFYACVVQYLIVAAVVRQHVAPNASARARAFILATQALASMGDDIS